MIENNYKKVFKTPFCFALDICVELLYNDNITPMGV